MGPDGFVVAWATGSRGEKSIAAPTGVVWHASVASTSQPLVSRVVKVSLAGKVKDVSSSLWRREEDYCRTLPPPGGGGGGRLFILKEEE